MSSTIKLNNGKSTKTYYDWRQPRDILPLEKFDFPVAHIRGKLDSNFIGSVSAQRMAGCSIKMSPTEIRDTLIEGEFSNDDIVYLRNLFLQFDGLELKLFWQRSGGTLYEMARAMIACTIRHPYIAEWMNSRTPGYTPNEMIVRVFGMLCNPGRE